MFDQLMIFTAASWLLIITPGPDMIYVMTRGIAQGRKAGVVSALGVTIGILVHTLFASMGLAMILMTSSLAFTIVKFGGACYLIFLGIKSFKDKAGFSFAGKSRTMRYRSIFIQGMLSNVLNPKVALFFLAFLPQFVSRDAGNSALQMLILGSLFALFGVIFLVALGYFSGQVGGWLLTKQKLCRRLNVLTGSVLVGLGLRLALIDKD